MRTIKANTSVNCKEIEPHSESTIACIKTFVMFLVAAVLALGVAGSATPDEAYAATTGQSPLKSTTIQGTGLSTEAKFAPKISSKNLTLTYGKASLVKVTGNNGKKITWKSSDTKVVQVKSSGAANAKLTPKKAGTATITAKVGSKKLTCKVTVKGKLNKTKLSVTSLDVTQLKLTGATAKSWKSSNTKCVKVTRKGKVYAGGYGGSAVITCTDSLGNKYKCKVTMSLPDVTCEMLGTTTFTPTDTTFYFKKFKLTNWTGKTVVLDNAYIIYRPYAGDSTTDVMLAHNSVYSTSSFTDSPENVPNGYSYTFVGFEGNSDSYYPAYSGRIFSMLFSVGDRSYTWVFETDGNLVLCEPTTQP